MEQSSWPVMALLALVLTLGTLVTSCSPVPAKSKIRVLQSLGRGLRLGDKSRSLKVFDISDDLSIDSKLNFTLRHFKERINIYSEQKFDYKIDRIKLK